jgi:N-glycosylase/DNA lyase
LINTRQSGPSIDRIELNIGNVDIEATLDGGQAFRWWPEGDGTYRGVIGRRVVSMASIPGGVAATAEDEKGTEGLLHAVRDYLNLEQDLEGFRQRFADDPCLGPALRGYAGLRVLRQDPWECLFSFITSSTSNIPRIKLNVNRAAEHLGYSLGPRDKDVMFPEPEVIAEAGEQFLRDLGFGFRAKYLAPAAEAIASGDLRLIDLREEPYIEAREQLTQLHGVGEKVADCVLAFSLDKPESFIVDRHILRALQKWYDLPESANVSYAADWARDHFGEYASLANQYMFHRERLSRRASEWGGDHTDRALPEDK